jgi:competence protein ComEC
VQAGYRNRFGHPAAQVLERYHARGIPVIETTRCGAATWRSDAPRQMQCLREHFPRYWHHRIGTVGMSEPAASQGILRP